jgi:hypothetical protein
MSIYRYLALTLALAGLAMLAEAQNPPAQTTDNSGTSSSRSVPQPALSGLAGMEADVAGDDTVSDMPQIPALLGGKGTSLAFQSELGRSNYLRGGLNVGAAYDDNALLGTNGGKSNTSYSVFPSLAIEQSWPRARWTLGYAGGVTVNQRLTNRNQGAHDLNFDSQFRLSPHVNLRIAEDFAMTTGFFDGGNSLAVSGAGGPNASLITPLATQRTNTTTAETNYHFALNDVVGASGSFYDLHFTNVPASYALANTQTESGSAFWLHRIFRHNWAGASYRFERLTFDPSGGETLVHSFALVDTIGLTHGFTFSGFVGPEYSDNRGLAPGADTISQFQEWSVAGGVEAGWQSARTSVSMGFSRRITDGGGLLGAVRSQAAHGDVRREFMPGWAVRLGGSYGNNDALTTAFGGSASTINVTSVSASLERNVGKSLGLHFGYAHDFQQQSGFVDPTQKFDAHRNRFFVTLSYQWAKPLGM